MSRWRLGLALALLLLLGAAAFRETTALPAVLHARDAARRQAAAALALARLDRPAEAMARLRQAAALHAAYASCAEGVDLERRGRFAAAAESFRLCGERDPELPAAQFAWAQALVRARGNEVFQETLLHLRRIRDRPMAPREHAAFDNLIGDLEDLLETESPASPLDAWTAQEILKILLRPTIRDASRYDGPRVPLQLHFRPGDTVLGAAAELQLSRVALALRDGLLAAAKIQIEGHTDSVEGGSEVRRRALAWQRAEAVRNFLVRRAGVPSGRLRTAAFADDYPLASNRTVEGRDRNRRVELVNLETKTPVPQDARRP